MAKHKRTKKRRMIPGHSLTENLAIAMRDERISVRELAKRANVHPSTIYRWFQKEPAVLRQEFIRAAEALGFTEEEIRYRLDDRWLVKVFSSKAKRDRLLRIMRELSRFIQE